MHKSDLCVWSVARSGHTGHTATRARPDGRAMEALARARQRREEAVKAQAERLQAETARTQRNAERAKEHGLV